MTSLETLRQLLIADQLKRTRAYVNLSEKGKWLPLEDVAKLAVNYERMQKGSRAKQGPPFPNRKGNQPSLKTKGAASGTEKSCCFGKVGRIWANCPKPKDKVPKGGTAAAVERDHKEPLRKVSTDERGIAGDSPTESRLQLVSFVSEQNKFCGVLNSEADITVIRRSKIPTKNLKASGPIVLHGAFGKSVTADLMYVPLRANCDKYDTGPQVVSLCPVTDELAEGLTRS